MNKNNFTWLLLHFAALLPGRLRVVSYFLAVFWLRLLENIEDSCEIWLEKCYFLHIKLVLHSSFSWPCSDVCLVFVYCFLFPPPKKHSQKMRKMSEQMLLIKVCSVQSVGQSARVHWSIQGLLRSGERWWARSTEPLWTPEVLKGSHELKKPKMLTSRRQFQDVQQNNGTEMIYWKLLVQTDLAIMTHGNQVEGRSKIPWTLSIHIQHKTTNGVQLLWCGKHVPGCIFEMSKH